MENKKYKELNFYSSLEIKKYLLKTINNNKKNYENFNLINKFIEEVNTETFKFNENNTIFLEGIYALIDNLEAIFKEVKLFFNKDDNFNYKFVSEYFFFSPFCLKDFIKNSLILKGYYPKEGANFKFKVTLITDFNNNLTKIRNFYIINYEDYSNNRRISNLELRENNIYNIFTKICNVLSEESIFTIFSLKKIKINNAKNDKELNIKIENIIKELKNSNLNIKIKKQEINENSHNIVNEFIENLETFKNIYKDYKIKDITTDIITNNSKITLLQFNIIYKSKTYNIKILQNNLKLYSYIYKENDTVRFSTDRIYNVLDFNRIFYIINEFENGDIKIKTLTGERLKLFNFYKFNGI